MVVPMVVPTAMSAVTQAPAGPIIIDIDEVIVSPRTIDDRIPSTNDRSVAISGAISITDDRSVARFRSVTDTRTIASARPVTSVGAIRNARPVASSRSVTRDTRSFTTWCRKRRGAIRDAQMIADAWPVASSRTVTTDTRSFTTGRRKWRGSICDTWWRYRGTAYISKTGPILRHGRLLSYGRSRNGLRSWRGWLGYSHRWSRRRRWCRASTRPAHLRKRRPRWRSRPRSGGLWPGCTRCGTRCARAHRRTRAAPSTTSSCITTATTSSSAATSIGRHRSDRCK